MRNFFFDGILRVGFMHIVAILFGLIKPISCIKLITVPYSFGGPWREHWRNRFLLNRQLLLRSDASSKRVHRLVIQTGLIGNYSIWDIALRQLRHLYDLRFLRPLRLLHVPDRRQVKTLRLGARYEPSLHRFFRQILISLRDAVNIQICDHTRYLTLFLLAFVVLIWKGILPLVGIESSVQIVHSSCISRTYDSFISRLQINRGNRLKVPWVVRIFKLIGLLLCLILFFFLHLTLVFQMAESLSER